MSSDGLSATLTVIEAIDQAISRGEFRGWMDCPKCKQPACLTWYTANPHANKRKRAMAMRASCSTPGCGLAHVMKEQP